MTPYDDEFPPGEEDWHIPDPMCPCDPIFDNYTVVHNRTRDIEDALHY